MFHKNLKLYGSSRESVQNLYIKTIPIFQTLCKFLHIILQYKFPMPKRIVPSTTPQNLVSNYKQMVFSTTHHPTDTASMQRHCMPSPANRIKLHENENKPPSPRFSLVDSTHKQTLVPVRRYYRALQLQLCFDEERKYYPNHLSIGDFHSLESTFRRYSRRHMT